MNDSNKRNIDSDNRRKIKIGPWIILAILLVFIFTTLINTISEKPEPEKKTEKKRPYH